MGKVPNAEQSVSDAYRAAGVDIAAADALTRSCIKPVAASTWREGLREGVGPFAAVFDPGKAGYSRPLLVTATDGVGTKLLLARKVGEIRGLGIDLVAMCVNDIAAMGAEPLLFLDYFATGVLEPGQARDVLSGVGEGCRRAGCVLAGGETAELPGMYDKDAFDLAGFAVGCVEDGALLNLAPDSVSAGDVLVGLASSGLHANGFTLVRKIVKDSGASLEVDAPYADGVALGRDLLTPTRIYARACVKVAHRRLVRGFAHITGGGLSGNVGRALPESCAGELDLGRWRLPPVFRWLSERSGMDAQSLASVLNCGLGMVAVAAEEKVEELLEGLRDEGERARVVGRVVKADAFGARVKLKGDRGRWLKGEGEVL